MEFRQYLRILRARRIFVAASLVACVAAAAAFAWAKTPVYTAQTQLFVSTSNVGADPSATYQGGLFSEERVLSYAQIVSSPAVMDAVIEQLGLSEDTQGLQAQIRASVPVNTVLLNVAVDDPSARRAQLIATAVATQFTKFVDRLEAPASGGASPVKVSVTSPAQLPLSPSAPRKKVYLAFGLILGLVLGIGGAVLYDVFDRRIRSEGDAGSAAESAVLGSVAEHARAGAGPPVLITQPFSARAEAYRRLRANLGALVADRGGRSFVITSAGPGEGESKTVVAANLGLVFAQAGHRVVLVDANLRRPQLAGLLGLSSSVGLVEAVQGERPLESVLQTWSQGAPLDVVGTGRKPSNPSELLGSQRFFAVLEELMNRYDVVIVDAPALLEATDAATIARATSGAVLVARPGSTRLGDLTAAAGSLRAVNATVLGVVLVRRVMHRWVGRRPRVDQRAGTGPESRSPQGGDRIPQPMRDPLDV